MWIELSVRPFSGDSEEKWLIEATRNLRAPRELKEDTVVISGRELYEEAPTVRALVCTSLCTVNCTLLRQNSYTRSLTWTIRAKAKFVFAITCEPS